MRLWVVHDALILFRDRYWVKINLLTRDLCGDISIMTNFQNSRDQKFEIS